jgi:hypothetical protein
LSGRSYTLNALHTDANFVNPANRGFTPGGVADRSGDVANKTFGTLTAGLQYHHYRRRELFRSTLPVERDGRLEPPMRFCRGSGGKQMGNMILTPRADAVHLAGNRPHPEGREHDAHGDGGWEVHSSEVLAGELRDAINTASDQTVKMAMINGNGLCCRTQPALNLSGTRSESAPTVARPTSSSSPQPALTIPLVHDDHAARRVHALRTT